MDKEYYRRSLVLVVVLVTLYTSACGTLTIETEPVVETGAPTTAVEETATATRETVAVSETTPEVIATKTMAPPELVSYRDDDTGFSFAYPNNWTLAKEEHAYLWHQDTVTLRLGYRHQGETDDLLARTGLPAGEFDVLEGTTSFLGQSLVRYGLFYEGVLKLVSYGGVVGSIVQAGGLEFVIVLDDGGSDYAARALPDGIIDEAEQILASFQLEAAATPTTGDMLTYNNDAYGFSLSYPATWTLAEVNDSDFVGSGSRSVQLTQGTVTLVIGYRRIGEDMAIMGSGAPAGDLEARGTIPVMNQDVTRYVLVYGGKDKVVFYYSGEPGTLVAAGGVEFAPRLDDFAPVAYESLELPPALQAEADRIVSSISVTP